MQVDRVSKISTSTTERATIEIQFTPKNSSLSKGAQQAASVSSSTSSSSATPPLSPIPNQIAAPGLQVTTLAATYSTTLAGKNYPESVELSKGVYIASVPSPPGITASGSSVQSAENSLNIKLDTLA